MPLSYSNPRMHAEIGNWPMGGTRRGVAIFNVESKAGKGERAVRVTRRDGETRVTSPKALTYARKVRIVDGDDGKTYVLNLTEFGFISVMQSNMQFGQEQVFYDNPRYAEIRALFELVEVA